MPDALDQLLAGRTYRPGEGTLAELFRGDLDDERPSFIPPDANYNPNLNVKGLVAAGWSPSMAKQAQVYRAQLHAQEAQNRALADEQAVAPDLAITDPNSSLFSRQLNDIFSKHPLALSSGRVRQMLNFKKGLVPRQPTIADSDIVDPELLARYRQRESQGLSDPENQAAHKWDVLNKQKRLQLIEAGMPPEEVHAMQDEDGGIPDETFAYQLSRIKNSGQRTPSAEDLNHISKLHQSAIAEGDPSDEAKLMWLQSKYPNQKKYDEHQWSEAWHALTPAKATMQLLLQQMSDSGYSLSPVLLHQYGVHPLQAPRWDKSGRRLMNSPKVIDGEAKASPSTETVEVQNQEAYDALPKGATYRYNGKTLIKE